MEARRERGGRDLVLGGRADRFERATISALELALVGKEEKEDEEGEGEGWYSNVDAGTVSRLHDRWLVLFISHVRIPLRGIGSYPGISGSILKFDGPAIEIIVFFLFRFFPPLFSFLLRSTLAFDWITLCTYRAAGYIERCISLFPI
ncbi:hypothetical protein HZH66_003930 [Vespula vulgaris]|uniref:Uncharacterized protein n=1 Tax=Vespula vulgaris TaxID=7454 RepID=A0A836XNA8_VESVU|nr:hypothetical protein HZH66_003930 [Vespula vulgaris]